jgi:hypothetical protein
MRLPEPLQVTRKQSGCRPRLCDTDDREKRLGQVPKFLDSASKGFVAVRGVPVADHVSV